MFEEVEGRGVLRNVCSCFVDQSFRGVPSGHAPVTRNHFPFLASSSLLLGTRMCGVGHVWYNYVTTAALHVDVTFGFWGPKIWLKVMKNLKNARSKCVFLKILKLSTFNYISERMTFHYSSKQSHIQSMAQIMSSFAKLKATS